MVDAADLKTGLRCPSASGVVHLTFKIQSDRPSSSAEMALCPSPWLSNWLSKHDPFQRGRMALRRRELWRVSVSGFHAGARQSAGPNPQFTDVVGTSILGGDLAKRHCGIMIEHHSDGVS